MRKSCLEYNYEGHQKIRHNGKKSATVRYATVAAYPCAHAPPYHIMKRNPYTIKLVSIIVTTYNEADNVIPLLDAIERSVPYRKEIIVVDDNSPDGTSRAVAGFIQKRKSDTIFLITRTSARNLTKSCQEGIDASRGDVIVRMDCDFSMPPSVIPKLLEKISSGYDVVVGSRFIKGGREKDTNQKDTFFAVLFSKVLNRFLRIALGRNFYDYTSGFIAAKREVFNTIRLRGDYGEYFIDLVYRSRAHNFTMIEIPYICLPRRRGESKTGSTIIQLIGRGRKYVATAVRLLLEDRIFHTLP